MDRERAVVSMSRIQAESPVRPENKLVTGLYRVVRGLLTQLP